MESQEQKIAKTAAAANKHSTQKLYTIYTHTHTPQRERERRHPQQVTHESLQQQPPYVNVHYTRPLARFNVFDSGAHSLYPTLRLISERAPRGGHALAAPSPSFIYTNTCTHLFGTVAAAAATLLLFVLLFLSLSFGISLSLSLSLVAMRSCGPNESGL